MSEWKIVEDTPGIIEVMDEYDNPICEAVCCTPHFLRATAEQIVADHNDSKQLAQAREALRVELEHHGNCFDCCCSHYPGRQKDGTETDPAVIAAKGSKETDNHGLGRVATVALAMNILNGPAALAAKPGTTKTKEDTA